MSPIISTLTTNWTSATDIVTGPVTYYVSREPAISHGTSFNGGSRASGGWGYGGGNTDALVINVSGPTGGTYKLVSISNYKWSTAVTGNPYNLFIRIESGSNFSTSTPIYSATVNMSLPNGPGAFEIPLPNGGATLNNNQNYAVGWGFAQNQSPSQSSYHLESGDDPVNFTDPNGTSRTLDFAGINAHNGSDPFDAPNGTSETRGQLPIFGFQF